MIYLNIYLGVNKQDIVTQTDELTNLALFEEGSVCSCDDIDCKCKCCTINAAINRLKRNHHAICRFDRFVQNHKKQRRFIKLNNNKLKKKRKIKFTIIRQPCESIVHLSDHLNKNTLSNNTNNSRSIDMDAIRRLAIESDFITNRIVERRISI